jgi:hypothetical protein
MLEVGRLATALEDRSHFGAWCVTSSPLILGYDLRDDSTTDRIWPLISNTEAIAINQVWVGHPGRQVRVWTPSPSTSNYGANVTADANGEVELWVKPLMTAMTDTTTTTTTTTTAATTTAATNSRTETTTKAVVTKVAAFILNTGNSNSTVHAEFSLADLGLGVEVKVGIERGPSATSRATGTTGANAGLLVRDVWAREDKAMARVGAEVEVGTCIY